MRCKNCKEKILDHAIFCNKCGVATEMLSTELSAKQNRKTSWEKLKNKGWNHYPLTIFLIIFCVLPIVALTYFFHNNVLFINLSFLIFMPLVLLPLGRKEGFLNKSFTIGEFFGLLKSYPKFMLFVFWNLLYLFLLKLICSGKPFFNYAYDPILNIVHVVMIFYWFAIVVPAPTMMIDKDISALKAILISYKAGKETRWQQFFVIFQIMFLTLIGIATAGLGLLIALPFSYGYIEQYYSQMKHYQMFAEYKL